MVVVGGSVKGSGGVWWWICKKRSDGGLRFRERDIYRLKWEGVRLWEDASDEMMIEERNISSRVSFCVQLIT